MDTKPENAFLAQFQREEQGIQDSPRSLILASCDDSSTDKLAIRYNWTNHRCNEALRRREAS